jgi:DNA-binding transcriptional LysR family regulator
MRCSSQGDMLAATRAGLGISALSCFVGSAYPDLVRVAPQKLLSVADIWLMAHPDLVELPAVRAVLDFVTASAREDRVKLRG